MQRTQEIQRCRVPAITLNNYQNDKMFLSLHHFREEEEEEEEEEEGEEEYFIYPRLSHQAYL